METTSMFHLDLERNEAGVLLCLMRLGMDAYAGERTDPVSVARLDRLPREAFKTLAAKLFAATDATNGPPLDEVIGLGNDRR